MYLPTRGVRSGLLLPLYAGKLPMFNSSKKKNQYFAETAGLIPLLHVAAAVTGVDEAAFPAPPNVLPALVIAGLVQPPLRTGLLPLPLPHGTLVRVNLLGMGHGGMANTLLAGATCVWKRSSLVMLPTR
jgi:hypothetical protein